MDERVDPERVIRDASEAGLRLRSREPTFLRYQYMLVFAACRKRPASTENERGPGLLRRLPGACRRGAASGSS